MSKKFLCVIALVLTLTMLLTACGGSSASSASSSGGSGSGQTSTAEEKILHFRLKTEPDTLDPHKTSGSGDPQVYQYQIYESLFREEADGSVVPALAESYELAKDASSITLHLREGVKFHNGDVMTADDVVFSLNRAISTGYNGTYVSSITNVEKLDDMTVKITMNDAYSPIISCLATANTSIVCKAYLEANGDDVLARNPVGTGAYKMVNWISGTSVEYEAFADYWRGEATIKHAFIDVISDNSTALIALETGEIHGMTNLNTSDVATVESNPELKFVSVPAASVLIFTFNNEKGLFTDPRLREAMALCIDREAIVESCFDGLGEPETSIMQQALPEHPDNFQVPERNVERAKELVAEAGYPDGITVKVPTIDNGTYSKPTVMFQEQVAAAGITLEVDLMDRAAWNEKVISNTDYEFCCWALPTAALNADFVASKFFGPNCGGGGNFSNCSIPELDELILKGRTLESGPERSQVYREICEIIRDNTVVIPIFNNLRCHACRAELNGFIGSPTLHEYFFDYYWAE